MDDMTERERRIFEAAVQVFAQKGYDAATTRDIAEAADVAEGTIFRYFKTKRHLLHRILHRFSDLLVDLSVGPVEDILRNSGGKDLKQVLHDILFDRMVVVEKVYPMASILASEILIKEDIRDELIQKLISRIMDPIRVFFNAMVEQGVMRGDFPPEVVFRTIFANIFVFIAQYKLTPVKPTREILERDFDMLFDIIINGIAVRE